MKWSENSLNFARTMLNHHVDGPGFFSIRYSCHRNKFICKSMFHMELNQLGRIIQLNKYICNMYSTYMAGGILSTH